MKNILHLSILFITALFILSFIKPQDDNSSSENIAFNYGSLKGNIILKSSFLK